MARILVIFLSIIGAGCMTTRPPTIAPHGPDSRFSSSAPYENIDNILGHVESEDTSPLRESPLFSESPASSEIPLQLGMGKQNVQIQLGSPTEVAIAGHPKYGNERWTYEHTFATVNGYLTATKHIYFENHHVVGWETD